MNFTSAVELHVLLSDYVTFIEDDLRLGRSDGKIRVFKTNECIGDNISLFKFTINMVLNKDRLLNPSSTSRMLLVDGGVDFCGYYTLFSTGRKNSALK